MKRRRRSFSGCFDLQLLRLGMNRREIRLPIEEHFRQLMRELIAHRVFDDERVGDADRAAVVGDAWIGALRDHQAEIQAWRVLRPAASEGRRHSESASR